jgi:hypothetical protein
VQRFTDDPDHKNARRVARVMVGDLLLYHKNEFLAGLAAGNVEEVLAEPIAEARKTYESRVPEAVRAQCDYLALEIERVKREQAAAQQPAAAAESPAPAPPTPAAAADTAPVPVEPSPAAPQQDAPSETSAEAVPVPPPAAPAAAPESASPVASAAPPAAAAAAPMPDPYSDQPEHKNARRIARVMVGDLLLYHSQQVNEGIKNGNLQELLSEQIAEARKTYEMRVSEKVRLERDYLALELERMIAERAKEAGLG